MGDTSDIHKVPAIRQIQVLRILDAAANRAGEGLRVIEDYLRFGLDDRHLTGLAKGLRHELAETLQALPLEARHLARETTADVGTTIATQSEQTRSDLKDVVAAAFQRTEQALRSLEEYSKLLAPSVSARLEALRYRCYTLERVTQITRSSLERLSAVRLCVLVEGGGTCSAFEELVGQLVEAGVCMLQLRDKRLSDRELVGRARQLRELTRGSETLAIINDRPDIAVLADADGVHVGQDELSVKDARSLVGPEKIVGLSTHSIEQARQAVCDGANYLGVGPVFPSATKSFDSFPGLPLVASVAQEIRLPALAIGGITAANVGQVRGAGLSRVAVGSAVTTASDPRQMARKMLELLRQAEG